MMHLTQIGINLYRNQSRKVQKHAIHRKVSSVDQFYHSVPVLNRSFGLPTNIESKSSMCTLTCTLLFSLTQGLNVDSWDGLVVRVEAGES